jgi:hypothetical protein
MKEQNVEKGYEISTVRYDILYYGDPGNETWPSIEGLD